MASRPFFDARRSQWVCKYKPDPSTGKWVRVVLCKHKGKPTAKPPQDALDRHKEFAAIEYNARHGIKPAPVRAKGLAAYLRGYANSQGLSARSGSNAQLNRHIGTFTEFAEARGIGSIQGVTRLTCREYLEERIKQVAHSSLKTERGYLVGAWSRAVEDGLMVTNPWVGVDIPGKPKEVEVTFWSGEEIGRIAGACSKPWQSDLVLVLANTGLRISTGLAMDWDWIDWGDGEIEIPVGVENVKTSYPLSIGRVALDVLQRRYATSTGSPLVFPNPLGDGGVVGYPSARAAIDRAIKKAKVKHGTCHDLRHSCARNMILAGIPITIVQRQLGHTTLAMTQRYTSADAASSARYVSDFGIGDG